jgi:hypothetical protein
MQENQRHSLSDLNNQRDKIMHTIIYRFKDSNGKTRKTASVTFTGDIAIKIVGTASEIQTYAAIDGNARSVGKLTIHAIAV